MCHVLGFDEGVEFFGRDVTELDGGFAKTNVRLVSGFGDLRGIVVADFGSEGGDEHERIVDVAIDGFAIGFNAANAVLDKAVAGVGEEFDGVEIIENHHRLENI